MTQPSNQPARLYERPFVLAAVTFLIALWPLLADLDTFVGPDEFTWVYRATAFTEGLRTGDLTQTYQAGHPGITLMWMQALGAGLRYYHAALYGPAEWTTFIAAERTITMLSQMRQVNGVVYAGVLVLIVLLTQRVFGSGVAWLTGFLLAFDPFALTEYRALRTEGTVTIFNMLGLVGLLLYIQQKRRPVLVLSGVLVGLAILSKVPSLALGPPGLLAIGWLAFSQTERPWRENLRQAFQHAAIWGVTILLTLIIGLPALWVAPVETVTRMYDWLAVRVIEGETGGNSFLLGEAIANAELGPRFYGLVLLYRSTPVLWFGVLALLLALITPARRWLREHWLAVAVIAGHVLVLFAVIAPSRLNFDRYALPMFPPLSLLAAVGYVALWQWLVSLRPDWRRLGIGAAVLILAGQSLSAVPHHPYYQTYWNPLLGGISQAVNVLPVGIAGEGIDQVADYLNRLPNADTLTLASANSGKISPLLRGDTIPMTNIDGKWIQADYAFLYLSQLQRDKQDDGIITYLRRQPALHTVTLAGLEYAWVYPAPGAEFYGGASLLEGRGSLYGYDLSHTALSAGDALTVTLYWRKEGNLPGDAPFVRLTDADSYLWAETMAQPRPNFEAVPRENMVESDAVLTIPAGMPPGRYVLQMGYYNDSVEVAGYWALPSDGDTITVETGDPFPPPTETLFTTNDEVALLNYTMSSNLAHPGETVWLTLTWQALTADARDYVILVRLVSADDTELAYWLGRPVRSGYPFTAWQAGQRILDPWQMTLPADAMPGQYTVEVALFDADTQTEVSRHALGKITVVSEATASP